MEDLIKRSDVWNITAILHSEFITIEQEQILERIDEMVDALPSADRPQEWIPCSERVPKWKEHTDDMVLVCYADGSVRFNAFMNWQWVQGEPIAWMPLPKPWKGADDE